MQSYDIPYVPSSWDKVKIMMELSDVKPGTRAADLGSGDGRVVIEMAKRGAEAYGFELDSQRAELGMRNVQEAGLEDKAFIHNQSFWDANCNDFDVITLYGITSMMERLEEKLEKELRPGTKIVSNTFQFPHWQPEKSVESVYLYVKK